MRRIAAEVDASEGWSRSEVAWREKERAVGLGAALVSHCTILVSFLTTASMFFFLSFLN